MNEIIVDWNFSKQSENLKVETLMICQTYIIEVHLCIYAKAGNLTFWVAGPHVWYSISVPIQEAKNPLCVM